MTNTFDKVKAAFAGRYTIVGELGHGGMATVYLANDAKHHRRVAIKVVRPELVAVIGAARFLREIEIAARLSHPHILPLYDSGEADGLLFYVMPHIEGESLRGRLSREKQLPIDEAVRLAQQIASALDFAHRQGIVHRDIKPENVLLHEGEALVADFGIALAISATGAERLTQTGFSIGTLSYMSPEQASGESHIDARSDIYSLGCVLYEMLAGEPPFLGPTAQAVMARILTEQPRPLRTMRATVPVALDQVVAKSLARLPADRYVTAARFSEALTRTDEHPHDSPATGLPVPMVAATAARRRSVMPARVAPWAIAVLALSVAAFAWFRPLSAPLDPTTAEVSTEEFQRILADEQTIVLDTRPHLEYSISHIPGALNVAARPGVPMSMYVSDVAEVSRLVGGDMNRSIVLYCNGPYCPKSRRLTDELLLAGHKRVRRYQLGIPVWRAFGGVTVIEADGLRHVLARDQTAVVIDAREEDAFRRGSLPGARHLPRSGVLEGRDVGEVRRAKDDGRLPMQDHNTRIIVIGRSAGEGRYVAQAIAHEAFHNVAYFPGTFEEARAELAQR